MNEKSVPTFFSKDNIHRAGWTAVIGVLGFSGGIAYNRIQGPQKVIIDTSNSSTLPINVTVQPSSGSNEITAKDVRALTIAIKSLQNATESKQPEVQVNALSEEVKRLRDSLAQQTKPSISSPSNASKSIERQDKPTFHLPPNVKGYQPVSFIGVKDSTCPSGIAVSGSPLRVAFRLVDNEIILKGSPLFFHIDRIKSDGNMEEAFESIFGLKEGINEITVSPELQPAKYRLSYGFYLQAELGEKYPNFYSRYCTINVQASVR